MKNLYLKYILLSVAISSSLLFTACGHEHTFSEATCTTPKTCTECNEVEGEALGHTWLEATTEAPKTCESCGLTDGEPLAKSESDKAMNPDYDNPEEYAAEDYYDTEETVAETSDGSDLSFNVDIIDVTAEGYKKDLEAGRIDQETYDTLMEFLKEAEALADENGDFSLDEVYEQTDANHASDGSSGYTTSTEQSSYQPDYAVITHGDEGLGPDGSTFDSAKYADPGLAQYHSN